MGGGGEGREIKKSHEKNQTKPKHGGCAFILQVIGVAQVINKSKGEEVFTSKDEEVK